MDSLKTYAKVNETHNNLSFGISKMEDIYQKRNGKADDPHRHDFYTIVLVKKAKGKHLIDFNEFPLHDNQVYFLSPGQVHQIVEEEMSIGYSIVFSDQFLVENNISLNFIDDLNLFNDYGNYPPLKLNSGAQATLFRYAEEIYSMNASNLKFKYQAIGSLLKLFLICCNNLCTINPEMDLTMDAAHNLLRNFKASLNKNYKEWHNAGEYASDLNVTADYLNRVIKSLTGKTTKEHIQSRLTVAAKRLLYFTDLSAKEIAFEIGFNEPANFSAFFKNCTGMSPSDFKSKR